MRLGTLVDPEANTWLKTSCRIFKAEVRSWEYYNRKEKEKKWGRER